METPGLCLDVRDVAPWAQQELAQLGSCGKRLQKRLCRLLTDCGRHPGASLPQACGSWGRVKGAYRCLSNPKVNPQDILASHAAATWQRMKEHDVVLAVADTTSLNHTSHPATTGLGALHHESSSARGLQMHSVMAFSGGGEPLGLLHVHTWARTSVRGKRLNRRDINRRSPQSKESHRWLEGYEAVADQCQQHLETGQRGAHGNARPRVVMVADREADIYELFLGAQARQQQCGLLVRALHPRRLEQEEGVVVWARLQEQPEAGRLQMEVPAQGTRKARTATLCVRYAAVSLSVPRDKKHYFGASEGLRLWALEARETGAPAGVEALHWKLLSTEPVEGLEQACAQLGWYAKRWGIEVFHKTLKSGCGAEQRQLGTREGLERVLIVDAVVAWRVMAIKQAARTQGQSPASKWFTQVECQVLQAWASPQTSRSHTQDIAEMVAWLARLGGFLGRKSDGLPGVQSLWLGLRNLRPMVELYNALHRCG